MRLIAIARTLTLAGAAALIAAVASPAAAAPPTFKLRKGVAVGKRPLAKSKSPDYLKIEDLTIKSVDGSRIEVTLSGKDLGGGRTEKPVTVYFVDGAHRHVLWQRPAKFTGQRGGFPTTFTVDVRGRAVHRGDLEAVIDACDDRAQCRKRLRLSGGDLRVDGRPTFVSNGRNGELRLTVRNSGPNPATTCRAIMTVGGRTVAQQPVPALARGRTAPVTFRYEGALRRKAAKVKLDCRDLAPSNNERRVTLQ